MLLVVTRLLAVTVCLRQAKAVSTMHDLPGSTASNAYPNRGDEAANPTRGGIVLKKNLPLPRLTFLNTPRHPSVRYCGVVPFAYREILPWVRLADMSGETIGFCVSLLL